MIQDIFILKNDLLFSEIQMYLLNLATFIPKEESLNSGKAR